jgi:RNA polymerase sigma-70 factor (ECF subfamily)
VIHAAAAKKPQLAQLFKEHAPYLWRVIRRMGINDVEADDLCQEVFLTAHRKLGEFEGRSSIKTWLYGICVRTVSDYRRRAHVRRESLVSEPPETGAAAGPLDTLEQRRAHRLLDDVLGTLDEDRRIVFVLYEVEELPLREISEITGAPLQTVYSRLKSAREHIEAAFRRAYTDAQVPRSLAGGNA